MYVCMTVFPGSKFFLLLAKTSDGLNYFCFIKLLCVLSPFSCVQLFATPWTHQAPLSMGILQARILGVGCHSLLQAIFWPRDGIQVSHVAGGFFTVWATREVFITHRKNPLTLFSFFGNVLVILDPLFFPINFRISLLSLVKNPVVILTWISKSIGEERYDIELLLSLFLPFLLSTFIGLLWYLLIKFPNFHHQGPIHLLLDFLLGTLIFVAIADSIF